MASKYILVETVEDLQAYFGAGLLHFKYRSGEGGYQQEFGTLWAQFKRDWENRNSWDSWDSYVLVEEDDSPTMEDGDG